MRARTLPTILAGLALFGAACTADGQQAITSEPTGDGGSGGGTTEGTGEPGGSGGGGGIFPQALVRFDDCATFLTHIKAEARERVGPYGLDMYPNVWFGDDVIEMAEMAEEEPAEEAAAEPASAPASADFDTAGDSADSVAVNQSGGEGALASDDSAGGLDGDADYTGTNVQELGIDEPDIIKTDGRRILAVTDSVLTYVDVSGPEPVVVGKVNVGDGWGHEMFFQGDRAFLLTNGGYWEGPYPVDVAAEETFEGGYSEPYWPGPAAMITEIDLSDPANMRVAATMRIQGEYLSARAIGDHVRLAVTSPPAQLPWLYPQSQSGEERATEANREIIEESTIESWLPSYELERDGTNQSGQLMACDRIHRPAEFSGFETVSVVDLDLAEGLSTLDEATGGPNATGVLASGRTVYSSLSRFYIATTEWIGLEVTEDGRETWIEDYSTQVHAFAIAQGEPTEYVASGAVEGSLLNQFSLDEHEGYLRILTTDGDPWSGEGNQSETALVVLEEQADRLVEVGSVGGLGKGERLFSARLMGDIGFAVTFRQIDPFYVLDLSDPTNPRVTGELKIPGVSTYLHPVNEQYVLGVGQDATEDGMTTGLKLSLFDVSDVTNPQEVSVWTLPDSYSPVEYDHRAFQMFGSTAIVPVEHWAEGWFGAIVFDIGDQIAEIGRIDHQLGDVEPSSDCRQVDASVLTPEASEFWWMAQDGYGRLQICGADAIGGWGNWYCDVLPAEEIEYWFYDDASREADLAALDLQPDDRIEMCWPDDYGRNMIQRSLIIEDTLWTMSWSTLQANTLDGFGVTGQVAIG